MKSRSISRAALLFAPLVWAQTAQAHGIAGNRYFDGTITFDDPAVADEAILPLFAYRQYPTQGSTVSENRINAVFKSCTRNDALLRLCHTHTCLSHKFM